MLLSDPDTARLLNTEFVPCWDTVRPVPQVTIDFGNGRVLKRTLAGNTVMSICAADGRVVDAYPGVYTPAAFKAQISDTLDLFRKLPADPAERTIQLAAWHRERFLAGVRAEGRRTTLSKALVESPLLAALGLAPVKAIAYGADVPAPEHPEVAPASVELAPVPKVPTTTSKAVIQSAILKRLERPAQSPPSPEGAASPLTVTPPARIDPLADPKGAFVLFSSRLEDVSKRAASVRDLRRGPKGQPAPEMSPEQIGKEAVEADSTINVRTIRPAVHLWFMANGGTADTRRVRDAMYRDLLHVPIDDPYLGLTDALIPGTPPGDSPRE